MFDIKPDPTFEAIINIPVPGKDPLPICFVFKHRSRKEFNEYFDEMKEAESFDAKLLSGVIVGWKNVTCGGEKFEFNVENLQYILDNYFGAASAIFDGYVKELAEGRRKN